jgi:hypothetical protein
MAENTWQRQLKWATYAARDHRLGDPVFRAEALEAARVVMRRVRENIEAIVDRLNSRSYQFEFPDHVYRPPPAEARSWADELAGRGVFLPIAFQAWMEVVGTVVLMGTDPAWHKCGRSGKDAIWYTDPLVVDGDFESLVREFEGWKFRAEKFGFEETGPFAIPFSPDDLHKAGVSGGAPYSLRADRPSVDGLVLNERHGFSFVAYLRHAFEWGGFPGFEIIDDRPVDFLRAMREGLVGL